MLYLHPEIKNGGRRRWENSLIIFTLDVLVQNDTLLLSILTVFLCESKIISIIMFLNVQGGPVVIPGFCLPKALQPLLPIFLQVYSLTF